MYHSTPRRDFLRTSTLGIAALNLKLGTLLRAIPSVRQKPSPTNPAGLEPQQLRGLVVDAARLPEKPTYYRRLIDFSREWNLNTMVFRLTDDQGSMLRFRSHPDLITHRYAFTPEEMQDLAEYGERRGVSVIPEVESFGHTRYITAVRKYAYLSDSDPNDRGGFNGLIPVHPETLHLIDDLYREVAQIFFSRYLHGGCDEVNWGGSEMSRQALRTKTRAEIWAEYLNSLEGLCQRLGKELIVWGDFVVHKEPDILPRLNKGVVVMDFQYDATEPQPLAEAAEVVIDQGLRVIGAPALSWCKWGPRVGEQQLRNIDAFVDAYTGIQNARCLGVIVTNWAPSRYIQGSVWDSFAYAAVALNGGSSEARHTAFRSFVERFYEARWSSTWQEIFESYYRIAPGRSSCGRAWSGPKLPTPWSNEAELLEVLTSSTFEAPPYKALHSQMSAVEYSVRRNRSDFLAMILSLEYLDHLFWRNGVLINSRRTLNTRLATSLIKTIADRDGELVEKLDVDWDVGRFSEGKLHAITDLAPSDQLVFRMHLAARFSRELALDDDRFVDLLNGEKKREDEKPPKRSEPRGVSANESPFI
jgi:hypothetical protein